MWFKRIFKFFENLGIDDTLPNDLVRRVKMHNILGFVSICLMVFFPITFLYLELYEGFYLLGIGSFSMIIPMTLNHLQYFNFSRFFAVLTGVFTFMCGVIMYGYDAGFIYGIIAMMCLPILFFKENRFRIALYGSILLQGLVLYFIFKNSIPLIEISTEKTLLNIMLLACCTTLILMYFISSDLINNFYENKSIVLVDQLTNRNEELKNFSYSTSHDLKQPLRTILNFISVLQKKKSNQLDKEGQHFLDLIESSGVRLDQLIDALLSHSVLGQTISFEKFDANQLVKNVLVDLEVMIKESNASISVTQLPMVVANKQEMGAVFQNLITNALKFKREDISPVIQISAIEDGAFWRFIVKDNGTGIEDSLKHKVFQMFQKGHNNQSLEGTGIGLANCKKIIENHSGKIWIDSRLDIGSTFSFTILKAPKDVNYN